MRFLSDDRKVESKKPCMQVICAGLSRCATSSLQAALESEALGIDPCMHMAHIAPHADRELLVIAALKEKDAEKRQKILHQVFDGYAATSDFPGWAFTGDLMDMYPDALIVLNQRESASAWVKSIDDNLHFFGTLSYYLPTFLWKTDRLHYWIHQTCYRAMDRRFGPVYLYSEEFYDLHNEWVRQEAKKRGRAVLEWRPSDGWEPLCKALNKDVPAGGQAFPRKNEAAEMKFIKRILLVRGIISWGLSGAAAWYGWQYGPGLLKSLLANYQIFRR